MSEQHQPFLRVGEVIPAFSLPGADGMPHSPWDYKQREHLLLILLTSVTTSEARGVLQEFKRRYRELREEECAVLVLTADTVVAHLRAQEELQLPFALLADPQGQVIALYTFWENATHSTLPSIVLANRYGAFYAQWIAEQEAELPSIDILLKDLQYMNKLCTP
ncbi:MAG TPA: redoxin domain-containing protein [Ktedonobacteraceae bacterium]|nr:redoxin domain-containing protein [Ktedonobacteraceae bacterium]